MKVHLIENSSITVDNQIIQLGDLSITQGLSYYLSFYVRGDYQQWNCKGQIRTMNNDSGGIVEAEFLFKPNLYIPAENLTFIRPYLKANTTKDIITTIYQAKDNQIPSESNCFMYSLVLINPSDDDDVYPLVDPSFVQIKPGVTIYDS